jgi:hypothetical protein
MDTQLLTSENLHCRRDPVISNPDSYSKGLGFGQTSSRTRMIKTDDKDSMFLWNIGKQPRYHTAQQTRL